MLKKLFLLFFGFVFLLSLVGCGKKEELLIEFSKYQFSIENPQDWTKVAPSVLGEKQIVKKIIQAYKHKNKELNILVSEVEVRNKQISFEEFVMANVKQFGKLVGYKQKSLEFFDIPCGDKKQKVALHKFVVDQSFLEEKKPKYYVNQFYLYDGGDGYIIQILGKDQDDVDEYTNQIKDSLKCK